LRLHGKKIWIISFVAAAIAGAILIFWLLKGRENVNGGENVSFIEEEVVQEEAIEPDGMEADSDYALTVSIPDGLKAVNLPVSFFGDPGLLGEGDRIDIISVYYEADTGIFDSKRIISSREIIRLEYKEGSSQDSGGSIIPDISISSTAVDTGNILVLTFFLTDDEILDSFTALEKGMLYVAVCPAVSGKDA